MSQSEDKSKLTPEEQRALEQYVREHPGSTLLKDERTAKYIERQRLRERGETPAKWSEIEARVKQEEKWKYGPDWTPPDLTKPLPKQYSVELWDALERFVQLPDSSLEDFRSHYPSFFPAWFYSVACGNDAEPERKTGLLAWQAWRSLLREAWHSGFHPEYVAQLVNIPTVPPGNTRFEINPVCDAQRAVLQIMLESWRARFCPKCGRRFVARKAADKYWPKDCFTEQRREKQRASKRNRRRKREKSSRRTKR
jgi:hypothetical protein